ncbi:MAG: metallophosphoesterase [Erysipelotrichia bacterium]|nr:metallophosphoesterase [Erysipelotrichia bacterium]
MKILHCSDLHFYKPWYEWISQQQDAFDVLCLTGDFLDTAQKTPIEEQKTWVREWFKTIHKPLFICSGNHDYDEKDSLEWLNKIPNVYGDGVIKTLDGIKFGCIPYLATDYDNFATCHVLLSHLPPANTKTAIDRQKKKDWGDRDLARLLSHRLLQPKILLCGHVHEPIEIQDKMYECMIYNSGITGKANIPLHAILAL